MDKKAERAKGNNLRRKILERDNHECVICGSFEKLEVHHKHALYLGGKSTEDNLVTLCSECHKFAPETGEDDFQRYLENKGVYVYQEMMKSNDVHGMVMTAYIEFLKERLDDYIKEGIIDEKQKHKILSYEMSSITN